MLTLPHLLTTARRFVDGVCELPRIATIADRDFFASQRHLELERATRWLAEERDGLKQQLSVEHDAHEETKQRWATVSDEWGDAAEECIELRKQLSAARADLEALKKWRLNLTEPCPKLPARTPIVVRIEPECEGQYVEKIHVFQTQLAPNTVYRHTPESLDALKQHDAERKSDAK